MHARTQTVSKSLTYIMIFCMLVFIYKNSKYRVKTLYNGEEMTRGVKRAAWCLYK